MEFRDKGIVATFRKNFIYSLIIGIIVISVFIAYIIIVFINGFSSTPFNGFLVGVALIGLVLSFLVFTVFIKKNLITATILTLFFEKSLNSRIHQILDLNYKNLHINNNIVAIETFPRDFFTGDLAIIFKGYSNELKINFVIKQNFWTFSKHRIKLNIIEYKGGNSGAQGNTVS